MSKRPKQFEDQAGNMLVEGPDQARFWIRALQLQDQIGEVQVMVQSKSEWAKASVPAIGHYIVDDKLKWIYVLHFTVDRLGVHDVVGKVWFASPKYEKQVFEARDGLADHLLKTLDERQKAMQGEYVDSPFTVDIRHYEAKKESGVCENPPDKQSR